MDNCLFRCADMTERDCQWAVLLSLLFLIPVLCAGLGNNEELKPVYRVHVQAPVTEEAEQECRVPAYEEPKEEDLLVQEWHGNGPIPEIHLARTVYHVLSTLPFIKDRNGEVHQLILETGRVESWLGHFAIDNRCAGGLGVFQMHESSVQDLLKRLPEDAAKAVRAHERKEWTLKQNLENNVMFGIAAASAYYWMYGMDKRDLSTVKKRGVFWKERYNTKLGAGTVREYVRRNSL